jgi:hypothetical protein
MTLSLFRLITWLMRRHGRAAVAILALSARAWLEDPANEHKRQAVVLNLRQWSSRAGGGAGRSAARLARQIERRRASVPTWERELLSLRYEIADLPPGAGRDAALDAYCAHAAAGARLVEVAARPTRARRRVLAAFASEAALLPGDGLTDLETERALEAIDRARAACYRVSEALATSRHAD